MEVECPFCGAARVPVVIESVPMVRMSRAATLAAALAIAGCRSEPTPIAQDPAAAKPTPSPVAKPTPAADAGLVDDPGGRMLYSTGSTHLLSAILTRVSGRPTLDLARDWLGRLPGFAIAGWERDPQGIYFGGNQMVMAPRSLLAFGELYRNGGRLAGGTQLISRGWIDQSWTPRTASGGTPPER